MTVTYNKKYILVEAQNRKSSFWFGWHHIGLHDKGWNKIQFSGTAFNWHNFEVLLSLHAVPFSFTMYLQFFQQMGPTYDSLLYLYNLVHPENSSSSLNKAEMLSEILYDFVTEISKLHALERDSWLFSQPYFWRYLNFECLSL